VCGGTTLPTLGFCTAACDLRRCGESCRRLESLEIESEPVAREQRYYVYIMASKSRVLYVGVTGFLMTRVLRHRAGEGGAFTRRYRVHRLVYYQSFQNVGDAIARETEIKKWRREKKSSFDSC